MQVTQAVLAPKQRYVDEYDKSDPFVDDSELPAELQDDAMEPVIEGFHVQRGPVPLKEPPAHEPRIKAEHPHQPDGQQPRKRRRSITLAPPIALASMSSSLQEAFGRLEVACVEERVRQQPHRRLGDDVNGLFSDVIRLFDAEVGGLKDAVRRKELSRGLVSRLEAALGMTRASIRQKMKNLHLKWEGAQRAQDIAALTARLQANIHRDVQQHKVDSIALAAASPTSPPPVYKPKWSLLMNDLLQLSALTLAEAGEKTAAGGNPLEPNGQQVQKELWEKLIKGWGELMDIKTLADRVRSSRRARRKKEQAKAAQVKARDGAAASRTAEQRPEQQRQEGKEGKEGKDDRGQSRPMAGDLKEKAPETKRTAEEEARQLAKWRARQEKKRLRAAEAVKAASASAAPASTSSSSKAVELHADGRPKKKNKSSHSAGSLPMPPSSTSANPSGSSSGKASKSSKSKPSSSSSSSSSSTSFSSPPRLSSSDLGSVLPPMSTHFHLPPDESQRWSQRYFPIIIGLSGAPESNSTASPPPSSRQAKSAGGTAAPRLPAATASQRASQP